jgi:hypothetical protein
MPFIAVQTVFFKGFERFHALLKTYPQPARENKTKQYSFFKEINANALWIRELILSAFGAPCPGQIGSSQSKENPADKCRQGVFPGS